MKKGEHYVFIYPEYGRPACYPGHVAHSGQIVQITRNRGKNWFTVIAADGWKGPVSGEELYTLEEAFGVLASGRDRNGNRLAEGTAGENPYEYTN